MAKMTKNASRELDDIKKERIQTRFKSVLAHSRSNSFGFDPKLERARFSEEVEKKNAFERLEWASKNYPGHVAMSTSFGIDSAVLLHLASTLIPDIPVIYVDTGFAPPETYKFVQTLQEDLDLNLFVTTSAVTPNRMISLYGELWNVDHNLYGRMRKVEPLKGALRDLDVRCLLVGLRGDQTAHRAALPALSVQHDALKLLPILNWDRDQIQQYALDHNLPEHPLKRKGYTTVGDAHSSRPKREGDENDRDTRFNGKSEECGLHTDGLEDVLDDDTVVSDVLKKKSNAQQEQGSVYNISGDKKHPTVVMVKKRLKDGSDCRRCAQIQERIEKDDFGDQISQTLFVEEGKDDTLGARLSKQFKMRTAPFFVITYEDDRVEAVESYFKLKKMLKS